MGQQNHELMQYGADSHKSDLKALLSANYTHEVHLLQEEHEERLNVLKMRFDRKVFEWEFFSQIIEANSANYGNKIDVEKIGRIENRISKITFLTAYESITIREWVKDCNEKEVIVMVADVIAYFLNQISVKEVMTGAQVMQLSSRLIASQPYLKVVELIFIFNKVLMGEYEHFQRIGIDTVLGWITRYYDESSDYMEQLRINERKGESRGETPWLAAEQTLKRYKEQQQQKKEIWDKIWNAENKKAAEIQAYENRKKEIEEYKKTVI